MQIIEMTIRGFGKFSNRTFTFSDGINVIYGQNEAGKSTLHTFIRSMLFGITRAPGAAAEHDVYARFRPWDNPEIYSGTMRIREGGTTWRITRDFGKESHDISLWNETENREETAPEEVLSRLLCGISETVYANSISIGQQKCAADRNMASELSTFISNMSTSGTPDYSAKKALALLERDREALEAAYDDTASVRYTTLLTEMSNLSREVSGDNYVNDMAGYRERLKKTEEDLLSGEGSRTELDKSASRDRHDLSLLGFSDERSINACEMKADTLRANIDAALKSAGKIHYLLVPVLLLLCACALTILAAREILPLIPAWVGAGLLVAGTALYRKKRLDLLKSCETDEQALADIYRRVLGTEDADLSEDTYAKFRERIGDLKKTRRALDESEARLAELDKEIGRLTEEKAAAEDALRKQEKAQHDLESRLEHLSSLKDRALTLQETLKKNAKIRADMDAVALASETIRDLSGRIETSLGRHLNESASGLIAGITGGIYTSMAVDDDLGIVMNTPERMVPIEQVSGGTADQIYLALRLSAAKLIQGDKSSLPLILDDCFALYDEERLSSALKWLPGAYRGQILIFTCQDREERILAESGIPANLLLL